MDWSQVKHFTESEFACRCCGVVRMNEDLVLRLDDMRKAWGKPIIVTSGYRCSAHNQTVSTTGAHGPHTTGRAVDVRVHGRDAFVIMRLALERGFTGFGFQQKGPHGSRFVHLDTLTDISGHPRPWIWSY